MNEQTDVSTPAIRIETIADFNNLPQSVRSAIQNTILVLMIAESLQTTNQDTSQDEEMVERCTGILESQREAITVNEGMIVFDEGVTHQIKLQLASSILDGFISTNVH